MPSNRPLCAQMREVCYRRPLRIFCAGESCPVRDIRYMSQVVVGDFCPERHWNNKGKELLLQEENKCRAGADHFDAYTGTAPVSSDSSVSPEELADGIRPTLGTNNPDADVLLLSSGDSLLRLGNYEILEGVPGAGENVEQIEDNQGGKYP